MKKIFLYIIIIIVGIISVSFLLEVNNGKENSAFIYVDKNTKGTEILKADLKRVLSTSYKNIIFSRFNSENIDSYIVSNGKNSIFITTDALKSKLFRLKTVRYRKTLVVVTSIKNQINGIDYSTFKDIYRKSNNSMDNSLLQQVINGNSKLIILPYNSLTIKAKPLSINGIFPSIYNVKKGRYPATFNNYISTLNHKLYKLCKNNFKNISKDNMFSMIAGGDIMLDRGVRKYIDIKGIYYPFKKIKYIISSNDIAFANLESPLTDRGSKFSPNKGIYFRADPKISIALKWCGFDILSLANNHIFDWGILGALDTERYLKKVGIKYSGIGKSIKNALKPADFKIGNTKICFVSMDDIYPTKVKSGKNILKSYTYNKDIKKDIESLKKKYDIVVISFHTGIEYEKRPEPKKIHKMESLIDYGADIIFGSHPHVTQDIEIYRNSLIVYSLGNFIFDQNWSKETSKGMLVEVGFIQKRPIYFRTMYVDIIRGQAMLSKSINDQKVVFNFKKE